MSKCEGFYIDTKTKTFYNRTGRALMTYHDPEFAEHVENLLLERWISVKERLPREEGYVIVGNAKQGWRRPAWYDGERFREEMLAGEIVETITHWQPLPEPPEEE